MSTSWYTWLEQGRNIRVSAASLARIASALQLPPDQVNYVFDLAGQPRPVEHGSPTTAVPSGLQRLIEEIPYPAYVLNERWDRIAWNKPLLSLLGDFSTSSLLQRNVLWRAFVDHETRSLTPDWKETGRMLVAEFQAESSRFINEQWMADFIDLMSRESEEFAQAWQRRDVVQRRRKLTTVRHPVLGDLVFENISMHPLDAENLLVSIFVPLAPIDGQEKLAEAGIFKRPSSDAQDQSELAPRR